MGEIMPGQDELKVMETLSTSYYVNIWFQAAV